MSAEGIIGLMDSAYFVSKNQLLKWIHETLQLQITYIEDLGSGSIYCQLVDAYYKQIVPMPKVNWKAKFQYEFVHNLKIFQGALDKINASKKIDVNKLSKAKYQDNLQLLQWLKRYLQLTSSYIINYNAVARRHGESFFSHHSQKKSYINKPTKNENISSIINTTFQRTTSKKELLNHIKSNKKDECLDKLNHILQMNQIKTILEDKESSSNNKLSQIRKIVYAQQKQPLIQNFNSANKAIEQQMVMIDL